MKKLIAILATAIAAGGLSAYAQDWVTFQTSGNQLVWDNFSTPGTAKVAGAGDVNVEILWALTGTSDPLGAGNGTNSAAAGNSESTIASMLSSGWTLAQNYGSGSGTAALGTVESTSGGVTGGKGGSIVAYNGGNPFEISTSSTGASGSTIEMVLVGFNGAASSYSSATALGWSSMINEQIGTTSGDPNATEQETAAGLSSFGVSPVPEPTTLALAGLGGLATLALRRRKA
jgi:hypothetical protein